MKCYFHPNKDAIYECSNCAKSICEDCMRFDEDERVVCPACTLEQAVQFADEDILNDLARARRLRQQETEKRLDAEKALPIINGWYVLIIVLLIGLNVYERYYIGRAGEPVSFNSKRFAEVGDPAPEMSYLLAQLFTYANDHAGNFPENLGDLSPRYLDRKPRVLNSEEEYVYTTVNGPEGFVLNLPQADRFGYRKLYATADGVLKTQ
jgi:DNA-directed RNA polymerase subunit RPC12/RpoP